MPGDRCPDPSKRGGPEAPETAEREWWIARYPDYPGRCYAYPTLECAREMHPDATIFRTLEAAPASGSGEEQK
jgi:hypothetical protein